MGEKTKWEGLWGNITRTGFYLSKSFNKKNIPDRFKIVLRYNKFYEKDSSKPRFVFCIAEGDAAAEVALETEDYTTLHSKVEDLAAVLRAGQDNADICVLPSESQENARQLREQAISLVEEITGEKWEFSYLTWY